MLIKRRSGKDIYLYGNGKKRRFGSWKVFVKHGHSTKDAMELSSEVIDSIPNDALILE